MMYMMLVPRNSFDLFDDLFRGDDLFFRRQQPSIMKTDIKERDDKYIIEMDLPGAEKENIDLSLDNGYLKISSKIYEKTVALYARLQIIPGFYRICSTTCKIRGFPFPAACRA